MKLGWNDLGAPARKIREHRVIGTLEEMGLESNLDLIRLTDMGVEVFKDIFTDQNEDLANTEGELVDIASTLGEKWRVSKTDITYEKNVNPLCHRTLRSKNRNMEGAPCIKERCMAWSESGSCMYFK